MSKVHYRESREYGKHDPHYHPEDPTMFYLALVLIGACVGALCYSIEVLNREGTGMLRD